MFLIFGFFFHELRLTCEFNINLEKNGMPEQSSVHFFGLRLSLLANFPVATSIPECMSIPESRVYLKLYLVPLILKYKQPSFHLDVVIRSLHLYSSPGL